MNLAFFAKGIKNDAEQYATILRKIAKIPNFAFLIRTECEKIQNYRRKQNKFCEKCEIFKKRNPHFAGNTRLLVKCFKEQSDHFTFSLMSFLNISIQ